MNQHSSGHSRSVLYRNRQYCFIPLGHKFRLSGRPAQLSFILVLLLIASVVPSGVRAGNIGVLLSLEIGPYVAMVEGLEAELKLPVQRFFFDKQGVPYSLSGPSATLESKDFSALVAVGPEALRFLAASKNGRHLVYGMVLNPENVIADREAPPCGVSLNIPAESQFAAILHYLPGLKRLGVLFDPANNQPWFNNAQVMAEAMGFRLVPLQVNSLEGRMDIVGDFSGLDAILFIPDKSVISKPVIQYVIKEGLLNRIPTIGYNRFFYDSGAALTFMINYHNVGRQVARQVESLLAGDQCGEAVVPDYEMLFNRDVRQSLHSAESGSSPYPSEEEAVKSVSGR